MRCLALFAAILFCSGSASAEPGIEWNILDPSAAARTPIYSAVQNYARKYRPTAIMVVQDDLVVATAGNIARKVNVRSVRKSLINALFGIAIERGQIDIENTLERLGVDDTAPSLTSEEKQATVHGSLWSLSPSGLRNAGAEIGAPAA